MKKLHINIYSRICLVALLMSFTLKGYSAAHMTMSIENCSSSNHEIQFDFMIKNDGDQPMKFNSGSFRLKHNAAILPSGNNEYSFTYVNGTSEFEKSFAGKHSTYNLNYNPLDQSMKLTMSTANYTEATAISIPVGQTMKVGRFALTINNNEFVAGTDINTEFYPNGNGVLVYKNGSYKTTPMSQTWAISEGSTVSGPVRDTYIPATSSSLRSSGVPTVVAGNYAGHPYSTSTLNISVNSSCKIGGEKSVTYAEGFSAFPNPTSGRATVAFTTNSDTRYALKVVDLIGNVLIHEDISATEGYNTYDLNMQHFAKGLYIVSLQSEGADPKTMQIVVQ
jgi:hypothetical protein